MHCRLGQRSRYARKRSRVACNAWRWAGVAPASARRYCAVMLVSNAARPLSEQTAFSPRVWALAQLKLGRPAGGVGGLGGGAASGGAIAVPGSTGAPPAATGAAAGAGVPTRAKVAR